MNLVAQDRQVAYAVVLVIALVVMMIAILLAPAGSAAPDGDPFGVTESRYNIGADEDSSR